MRASDGAYYVTKFQNSPQGVRILANEMFATSLGLWLGLPMPQPVAIEVCDWLIEDTAELRVQVAEGQVPCSSGLQFGSRYPYDLLNESMHIFDYLPEQMMAKVNESLAFARVLVLDKWLGNTDGRQSIYMKKPRARHFKVMFIDQGYCLNAENGTSRTCRFMVCIIEIMCTTTLPAGTPLSRYSRKQKKRTSSMSGAAPRGWYQHGTSTSPKLWSRWSKQCTRDAARFEA